MKRWFKILFLALAFTMLSGAVCPVAADVDLVNDINVTTDQFEQWWHYEIKVQLVNNDPSSVEISALEGNVTFDNTIFYDMEITDQISSVISWETSMADAYFETNGNTTVVKFLKANQIGGNWIVGGSQTKTLYILSFKVSPNAALGRTNFLFDHNFAKVKDENGDDITGQLINNDYYIVPPDNGIINFVSTRNGTDQFERNYQGGYSQGVKVAITPQSDSKIRIIEATVTYNNDIFYDVSVADQQSSSVWENSIVNASYDVNGSTTTIKYYKESTDHHELWEVNGSSEYVLYYITFKVKRDAPLGVTYFGSSVVEVTSNADEDRKGSVGDHAFTIIEPTNGLIDLISTPNGNDGEYERNFENQSTYSNAVEVSIKPQANSQIWSIEATVTFNNTIFYDVAITDRSGASGSGSWATSIVNAAYSVDGDVTTVRYFKEKSYEGRWNVSSGVTRDLFWLTFKVTRNAELGPELINFVPSVEILDAADQIITGTKSVHTLMILTDNTTPNTSINTSGGWFKTAPAIDLWTDETEEEVTISYSLNGGGEVDTARAVSGLVIPSTADLIGL